MNILVVDNYDSFTYNLVHLLKELDDENIITVLRNDKLNLDEINQYDKIMLSPGPGIPSEAGQMIALLKRYIGKKPILGICLGHQAIAEVLGGKLRNLQQVLHGIQGKCEFDYENCYLFNGMDKYNQVGHYHSWVVDESSVPSAINITARSEDGLIMALSHKEYDVHGLQFHPESILTPSGKQILHNWINR